MINPLIGPSPRAKKLIEARLAYNKPTSLSQDDTAKRNYDLYAEYKKLKAKKGRLTHNKFAEDKIKDGYDDLARTSIVRVLKEQTKKELESQS